MLPDEIIWKTRELEILRLLAEGLTNSEVGARLHLAHETVRWYNKHIFEKLGVSNRTQAVRRATELGLLQNSEKDATPQKVVQSAIRYVRNGDVHLAYQVIGSGPVDLLFIHGFLSNLELAWEDPGFTSFFEQVGKFARVILFDKRGVGLSDRIQGAPTLEDTIADALCVLDAVGSQCAFVMGTSEGGAAAVLLASTYPKRVLGLILYASTPKLVREGDEPAWADTQEDITAIIHSLQESWGGPWAIRSFAPSHAHDEAFRAWWAKVLRASSSPSSVKSVLEVLREIDIRPLLPHVHTRTLVVHKTGDRMVNVEAGRYFATHMPNARWIELPGADHFYFVESAALISAIRDFCSEKPSEPPVDTWIAIVLYISLSHRAHEKIIQAEFHTQRAKHTFFTEEGALAVFDSPSRAIQCALQLREMILEQDLKISLHIGECDLATGKPTPAAIEIARRAAELAQGKVMLTQTLRDILAGAGVIFDMRRIQFDQKITDALPVYALA